MLRQSRRMPENMLHWCRQKTDFHVLRWDHLSPRDLHFSLAKVTWRESLTLRDGIFNRSIEFVSHTLAPASKEIFSSNVSWLKRSLTLKLLAPVAMLEDYLKYRIPWCRNAMRQT